MDNYNRQKTREYVDLLRVKQPMFKTLEIETINRCNGKCSFCPVNSTNDDRILSKMSEDLFNKILVELVDMKYSGRVSLYSNNEPFLDDRIVDFSENYTRLCPMLKFICSQMGLFLI